MMDRKEVNQIKKKRQERIKHRGSMCEGPVLEVVMSKGKLRQVGVTGKEKKAGSQGVKTGKARGTCQAKGGPCIPGLEGQEAQGQDQLCVWRRFLTAVRSFPCNKLQ